MELVSKAINELLKRSRRILGMYLLCEGCNEPLSDGDAVVGEVTGIYRTGVHNGIFNGLERIYHAECYIEKSDYSDYQALVDDYRG